MTPSEWKDHSGSAMPVDANMMVGICFRSGAEVMAERAGNFTWNWAPQDKPVWAKFDIVSYREWLDA